ncbi:hypothetical protein E2C01_091313 [Portunus trituberculatus]|uniref:Uncharacterized protein n=1 Tax=Portunus trituberculatus TaxID=210409 RepID=A0A5B7JP22_PORTR|nr:hypothetical protein [Portunus trituberculatus]
MASRSGVYCGPSAPSAPYSAPPARPPLHRPLAAPRATKTRHHHRLLVAILVPGRRRGPQAAEGGGIMVEERAPPLPTLLHSLQSLRLFSLASSPHSAFPSLPVVLPPSQCHVSSSCLLLIILIASQIPYLLHIRCRCHWPEKCKMWRWGEEVWVYQRVRERERDEGSVKGEGMSIAVFP